MKITLEIPEYQPQTGIKYKWEDGFDIGVTVENGVVHLVANSAGLISLANQLLILAQKDVPSGIHMHLDEFNSLDEGSSQLILEKK